MNRIAIVLIAALVPVIVSGVLTLMKKESEKADEQGKVRLPDLMLVIGLTGTLIFIVFTVCSVFFGSGVSSVVFAAFALLSGTLIVGVVNCRIDYDKDGFTHKSFFGIKRRYRYDELTEIENTLTQTTLYAGKRRIRIDAVAKGGKEFIKFAKRERGALTGGALLPVRKKRKGIFNGHIKSPALFAFLFGLLFFFGIFLFIISFTGADSEKGNTSTFDAVFVSCERGQKEVLLRSEDDVRYIIKDVPSNYDTGRLSSVCDGKTKVSVEAVLKEPEIGSAYYLLYAVHTPTGDVLSREETERFEKIGDRGAVIARVIAVFFGVFSVFAFIVGRYPDKFPRWFVRLFYRDKYVIYDTK